MRKKSCKRRPATSGPAGLGVRLIPVFFILMITSLTGSPALSRPRNLDDLTAAAEAPLFRMSEWSARTRVDTTELKFPDWHPATGSSAAEHKWSIKEVSRRSVGAASTYNPSRAGEKSGGGMTTASGERYDAKGWTAAVQTDLRSEFGGVRFGRSYRPTYAIVTAGEKSAVVKINDVGPLAAGRVIDLSEEVMRYFDPSLQQGVLAHVTVLPLLGGHWRAGPIAGVPPSIMAGDCLPEL